MSHSIALPEFPILKTTPTTKEETTTPNNAAAVTWATLYYKKLTMDPNIDALTKQYCDSYRKTFHLADSFWKIHLTFLPPHFCQKIYQYNIKHGATSKLPPNNPPASPPTLRPHRQQYQHILPTINLQLCQNPNHTLTHLTVH